MATEFDDLPELIEKFKKASPEQQAAVRAQWAKQDAEQAENQRKARIAALEAARANMRNAVSDLSRFDPENARRLTHRAVDDFCR